ncbi:MAG: energy-coupling factor transporter transmembrane protein EcfT [Lachnospiraceae bacterium]|nr:energy-coupling factor transporter transmembrane protein EcfT [Lachnospiraceae bacterium]
MGQVLTAVIFLIAGCICEAICLNDGYHKPLRAGAAYALHTTVYVRAVGNLPLLLVYLRRLIIAVIAAYPVVKAPTGKLIASLDKLKIPRTFTISLAVLFRFLPTVGMEYSAIRRAQRYREIGISP